MNTANNVVPMSPKKTVKGQGVESIFSLIQKKFSIDASPGNQDKVVAECIRIIASTGLVFDRGGLVGIDLDDSIHQFSASTLRLAVSRLVDFTKDSFVKGQQVSEKIDCPSYIGDIAKMTKWDGVPIVDSITDHPVLTPDNRIIGAGFDKATGIFGRFEESDFFIPENPTIDDAAAALTEFMRLLETFEFETPADMAAMMAGFMTAVARPVLPTAPLNLLDAPMSGSGKGYGGGLMSRIAFRKTPNSKQLPSDHDEIHKAVVSALISAQPVIFFDELATNELDCPAIRTLATAEVYSARLLGVMREVNLSTRAFVICTGNNISPTADTARRILHIRLNPKCENPSARHFKFDASAEMSKNRNKYVSLLLTIQRAFLLANKRGEITKPDQAIGGFSTWDFMCRQPIMWLLEIDPCSRMLESMKSNPAKNDLLAVILAWKEAFGTEPMSAGKALKDESFLEIASDSVNRRPGSVLTAKGLGMWLKKHKDQIVQGIAFQDAGMKDGYQMWVVGDV